MVLIKEFKIDVSHYDPIMQDHTVQGISIMPGVTLIDVIIRAMLHCQIDPANHHFEKLLFSNPIWTTAEFDRRVKVALYQVEENVKVEIKSHRFSDDYNQFDDEWKLNASVLLTKVDTIQAKAPLNLNQLEEGMVKMIDLDDVYGVARNIDIIHGPFMKTEGKVRLYKDRVVAEINLSEKGEELLAGFYFHPALLDSSTLPYSALVNDAHSDALKSTFIPMFVKKFTCIGQAGSKIYAELINNDAPATSTDILYNNVNIYNENGEFIGEYEQLGAKNIRAKDFIQQMIADELMSAAVNEVSGTAISNPAEEVIAAANPVEASIESVEVDQDVTANMICAIIKEVEPTLAQDINRKVGFYDLGLSSTDLLQIVKSIEAKIKVELYPTLLFEYKNVEELAGFLLEEYETELTTFFQSTQKPTPKKMAKTGFTKVITSIKSSIKSPSKKELETAATINEENKVSKIEDEQDVNIYAPYWKPVSTANSTLFNDSNTKSVLFFPRSLAANEVEQLNQKYDNTTIVSISETATQNNVHFTITNDNEGIENWVAKEKESITADQQLLIYFETKGATLDINLHGFIRHTLKSLSSQGIENFTFVVNTGMNNNNNFERASYAYFKSARLEFPKAKFAVLKSNQSDIFNFKSSLFDYLNSNLSADIAENGASVFNTVSNKNSWQFTYTKEDLNAQTTTLSFKKGGRYLITGGAGKLGLALGRYLVENYEANVFLMSRRAKTEEVSQLMEDAKAFNAKVIYASADLSNKTQVFQAIRKMRSSLKGIDGVFHSAGLTKDARIVEQTQENIDKIFAAKIAGVQHLDAATKSDNLDCFISFSSLSSIVGNMGQADYAYSNAYLNEFTVDRAALVAKGERKGKSISIAWPLWRSGGLMPDEYLIKQMKKVYGLRPLENEEGFRVLEACMQSNQNVLIPIAGDIKAFDPDLLPPSASKADLKSYTDEFKEKKSSASQAENDFEDVAVIGISCRFPQSENKEEFWNNLKSGKDCISEIPADRWKVDKFFDPAKGTDGKYYCKWGGFIKDHDKFDPLFFRLTPHEAETMDPHERLFIQETWKAFEDAGYNTNRIAEKMENNVGVFVGAMWNDYELLALESLMQNRPVMATSSSASIANRVSFLMDLNGPSVPVDSMCSSSLLAVHLACQSLRKGECKAAVVGGVNLSIHPWKYIKLSRMQMLSPDGRCKSFGENANGYVPGEGVASMILKPLAEAQADGDQIYAVIKGTAVNHCGRTAGMTVPDPVAQSEVIKEAIKVSGVEESEITYIESHGTGTDLGDPIEIVGLKKAFKNTLDTNRIIGSVKSNIGHLEAAAGAAALIKVCLQLKNNEIAPSLHSATLNDKLNLKGSGFDVVQDLTSWKSNEEVIQKAGVSSFGAGGVNVHMILSAYEEVQPEHNEANDIDRTYVLPVSARTKKILMEYVTEVKNFVTDNPSTSLINLEFTYKFGRTSQKSRTAFIFKTQEELLQQLEQYLSGTSIQNDVENGQLSAWLDGEEVKWDQNGFSNAKTISAPTYPFEKRRCWLPVENSMFFDAPGEKPKAKKTKKKTTAKKAKTPTITAEEIKDLVLTLLSKEIKMKVEEIPMKEGLMDIGIDSIVAMRMVSQMEKKIGKLPIDLFIDNPKIEKLIANIQALVLTPVVQ